MLERLLLPTVWIAGAALAACGGLAASTGRGADASMDGTITPPDAGSDGGSGADVGRDTGDTGTDAGCLGCDASDAPVIFPGCPSAPPAAGDPCTAEGEQCEYGPSWWLVCNTVMRCAKGTWQQALLGGAAPCAELDAGGSCPATWAEASAIDAGTTLLCPAVDCQYPEGYCECLSHCGGGGAMFHGGVMGTWACRATLPGCPSPRPRLGTPCSEVDGGFCDYSFLCGCGQDQSCKGGIWQGFAAPPCP